MERVIAGQEEHHRKRSFAEEVRMLVERYGLKWRKEDETVKTVSAVRQALVHPAEAGCEQEAHFHLEDLATRCP